MTSPKLFFLLFDIKIMRNFLESDDNEEEYPDEKLDNAIERLTEKIDDEIEKETGKRPPETLSGQISSIKRKYNLPSFSDNLSKGGRDYIAHLRRGDINQDEADVYIKMYKMYIQKINKYIREMTEKHYMWDVKFLESIHEMAIRNYEYDVYESHGQDRNRPRLRRELEEFSKEINTEGMLACNGRHKNKDMITPLAIFWAEYGSLMKNFNSETINKVSVTPQAMYGVRFSPPSFFIVNWRVLSNYVGDPEGHDYATFAANMKMELFLIPYEDNCNYETEGCVYEIYSASKS